MTFPNFHTTLEVELTMTRPALFASLLLGLLGCLAPARAEWSLTNAEFNTEKKITVNEWSLKDGLSYTAENGKLAQCPTRQMTLLANDRPPIPPSPADASWQLLLKNGDLIQGEPVALHEQLLQFKTSELETIDVPLKLIAALQAKAAKNLPALPKAAERDSVRFKSGDTLDGLFVSLADAQIKMQSDLGESTIPLENVDRLSLGGTLLPRILPPLSVRITFSSGSVLTTKNFTWTIAQITLKDYADQDRKCSPEQIASIQVLGGRVVWLTELDPSKEETSSFLGTQFPVQINRNVLGGPLKIARTSFDRGLGVHTASRLTYDLDGSFNTFSLRAGLDDSALPHGQANLAILLDAKTLWSITAMKAGQLSEPLLLPLTDGHKLELLATSPEKLDVLGRVNWVNPALIRP